MDKKLNKIHKNLILTKLTMIRYNTKSYNTIKHKQPYNWPPFSAMNNAVNNVYTSLHALIRILY